MCVGAGRLRKTWPFISQSSWSSWGYGQRMMKNNTRSALMEPCKRECLEGETSYMKVGQARQDCDAATERKLGSQRIKLAGKGEE